MEIEFDPDKNRRNIIERQISFELVEEFEWETALEPVMNFVVMVWLW